MSQLDQILLKIGLYTLYSFFLRYFVRQKDGLGEVMLCLGLLNNT